jgi:hypothetical protein
MLTVNLNDFEQDSNIEIQSYQIVSDTAFYRQ